MKLDRILDAIELNIDEKVSHEDILKEFKKDIQEWALSILPSEVSYSRDGWMGATSEEEAVAFNEALEEVTDSILEETK